MTYIDFVSQNCIKEEDTINCVLVGTEMMASNSFDLYI